MKSLALVASLLLTLTGSAHAEFEFRAPKAGLEAGAGAGAGSGSGSGSGGGALAVSVTQNSARLLNGAASYNYSGGVFLQDHLAGSLVVSGGTGPYTYQWETVEWAPIVNAQCNVDETDWVGLNCTYDYGAWTAWGAGAPTMLADTSGLSYAGYCENDDYVCYDAEPVNVSTESNPFFEAINVGGSMYVFHVRVTVTDSLGAQASSTPLTIIYPGY